MQAKWEILIANKSKQEIFVDVIQNIFTNTL